ncbi:MAG: alanyl-tRNA editing protein, partial [Acidobacteriota bacterium]|nr:alanyl-tRNA editing protein [Acidobacteriota bacterium]
ADASPDRTRIYLDRTAFYPTSGGQPFDLGTLGGVRINEVVDEDGRVAHVLSAPLEGDEVAGSIDWTRRFDHMQQHTGQHLLSAVLLKALGAPTVSFHLGADYATIDIARAALEPAELRAVEEHANRVVFENRPVAVSFADASDDLALRKPTEREGTIRIITIADLDRSACGGTHVRATGEIGPILLRKLDKVRGNVRIEFLCGMRAVRRARADYEALAGIARQFSSTLDEVPPLVAAQGEKLQESDKARRKLAGELAQAAGRELHAKTAPDQNGLRRVVRKTAAITDELRAEAQSFAACGGAAFLAVAQNPPSVLVTASPDSGLDAGKWLKKALPPLGGRGGGNPTMAQGSLQSSVAVDVIVREFETLPE